MKKGIIIYLLILAGAILLWYGYKNWGWFSNASTSTGSTGSTTKPNVCEQCLNQRQAEGLTFAQAMDSCIASGKCHISGVSGGAMTTPRSSTPSPTTAPQKINYVISQDHARQIGLIQ